MATFLSLPLLVVLLAEGDFLNRKAILPLPPATCFFVFWFCLLDPDDNSAMRHEAVYDDRIKCMTIHGYNQHQMESNGNEDRKEGKGKAVI
jgi:hypothetical protein